MREEPCAPPPSPHAGLRARRDTRVCSSCAFVLCARPPLPAELPSGRALLGRPAAGRGASRTSSRWASHVAARALPSLPWARFLLNHSAHVMCVCTAPTKRTRGLPASPSPCGSLVSSASQVNPLASRGCHRAGLAVPRAGTAAWQRL